MSRPEKAAEPSMDEILASIRKIISEEPSGGRPGAKNEAGAGKPAQAAPAASGPNPRSAAPAGGGSGFGSLDDLLADDRRAPAAQPSKPAAASGMAPLAAAADSRAAQQTQAPAAPQPGVSPAAGGQGGPGAAARWSLGRPAPVGGGAPERNVEPYLGPAPGGAAKPGIGPAAGSGLGIQPGGAMSAPRDPQPAPVGDLGTIVPGREAVQRFPESVRPSEPALGAAPTQRPAEAAEAAPAPKLSLIDALQSAVNEVENESSGAGEGGASRSPALAARPAAPSASASTPAPAFAPAPATPAPLPVAATQAAPVMGVPPRPAAPVSPSAPPAAAAPVGAAPARAPVQAAPQGFEVRQPVPPVAEHTGAARAPVSPAREPARSAGEVAVAIPSAVPTPAPVLEAKPAPVAGPAAAAPVAVAPAIEPASAAGLVSALAGASSPMTILAPPPTPAQVRTLEDTVAELLRPMLREWLDAHMPRIVEKALRIEVAETFKAGAPPRKG